MISQEHYDNVKRLLDNWADWIGQGGNITEGAPTQSIGAPDARIHTIEDMEIEVNKRVCFAVHEAVYELPVMERNAILMHYGIMECRVWRADFDKIFDFAVGGVFKLLREKVAC